MANARFLWSNITLETAATVVASSEATGYAATNAKSAKRGLPWRSATSTGHQTLTVSFTVRTIKAVALINPLGHVGGTIKAESKNGGGGYAAFDGGTGLFTVPSSNRTRLVVLYNTAGVVATDVRITFTNTGAVSSYVEIGIPFIADSAGYFEPTAKLSNDRDMQQSDPSVVRATVGGQRQAWRKQKPLSLSGYFPVLPRADVDSLMQMWDVVGSTEPLVFTQQAETIDQTIYGTLPMRPRYEHVAGNQWGWRFAIEESL